MYSKRAAQYHDLGDSVQIQEETIKKIGCYFVIAYTSLSSVEMVVVFTVPKNSNNNRVFSYLFN